MSLRKDEVRPSPIGMFSSLHEYKILSINNIIYLIRQVIFLPLILFCMFSPSCLFAQEEEEVLELDKPNIVDYEFVTTSYKQMNRLSLQANFANFKESQTWFNAMYVLPDFGIFRLSNGSGFLGLESTIFLIKKPYSRLENTLMKVKPLAPKVAIGYVAQKEIERTKNWGLRLGIGSRNFAKSFSEYDGLKYKFKEIITGISYVIMTHRSVSVERRNEEKQLRKGNMLLRSSKVITFNMDAVFFTGFEPADGFDLPYNFDDNTSNFGARAFWEFKSNLWSNLPIGAGVTLGALYSVQKDVQPIIIAGFVLDIF